MVDDFNPGAKRIVFIIDDEALMRDLYKDLLADCEVRTASSGNEAIEWLEKYPEAKIDLVVSDYDMPPGPNGVQTLKRIRVMRPGIKAVLVSATIIDDLQRLAQENGFDSWLVKPFSSVALEELVHRVLSKPTVPA
ncbi:MAG: response regulator [Verrucomicrobia bacterium]|nr:response regulator [Verrucomicrobiota bacterium]